MEALTSFLLLAGLLVIWGLQQKRRNVEEASKKAVKKSALFKAKQKHEFVDYEEEIEDIRERHLTGVLKVSEIPKKEKFSAITKIEKMSVMKRAIIWSEILDKPISERN